MFRKIQVYIALTLLLGCCAWETAGAQKDKGSVIRLSQKSKRTWISPETWANPLKDWHLNNGRMECTGGSGDRSLFLLTHDLSDQPGFFTISVKAGRLDGEHQPVGEGWIGFRLGVRGESGDYRDDAVRGTGFPVGITTEGKMFIGEAMFDTAVVDPGKSRFMLQVEGRSSGDKYLVTLTVMGSNGNKLGLMDSEVDSQRLTGGVALACHAAEQDGNVSFWFSEWKVGGEKFAVHEERAWGPVLFCHYTLTGNVLKLAAQLAPVGTKDDRSARLEVDRRGIWETVSEAPVDSLSRTASFRVENWNDKKDVAFRIKYSCYSAGKKKSTFYYTGTVRHEPWEKEEIVVAVFSGSHDEGFPNAGIVKSVSWQDPDLLVFTDGKTTPDPAQNGVPDYLGKWFLFGWAYADLLSTRPSIILPGGQEMVAQGMGGDCTEIRYAGVSFAVIDDQKFRSDPASLLPEARITDGHATNPAFNPSVDGNLPDAILLGDKQEQFLDAWSNDWTNGTWMKVVLSQHLFSNMGTLPVEGSHDVADQDFASNGWPQTARNRALTLLRKGYAFHIAASQGIGGVIQYGVTNWRDAGYAFAVPPVSNITPGRWCPREPGIARFELDPRYTGDYLDGFGNKMTVYAAANPSSSGLETARMNGTAAGYGLVRFNRSTRDITMECWPRQADSSNPESKQYLGWPLTINQLRNRAQYAQWELPLIKVPDMKNSVMQVISESTGMIQYTIRINGHAFRPPVDKPGKYTLFVGDPGSERWVGIPGFEAAPSYMTREYVVKF